jgi:hypothetical protein
MSHDVFTKNIGVISVAALGVPAALFVISIFDYDAELPTTLST